MDASALRKFLAGIDRLREVNNEIQANSIAVLIEIALNPGIISRDLKSKTDIPAPTLSRILLTMMARNRNREEGYGLVEMRENPDNRREKRIFLTEKGEAFVKRLSEE